MWFRNKDDEGVIHPEFSEEGLLALVTIALAFTVVSNSYLVDIFYVLILLIDRKYLG
jgi:hypothetical protein